MTIVMLFIIVDIGIALTMSPSQTTALSPLPREYDPHGVAILNTLQQLSAAIGSSLFIGIMSATQLKALSNQVQEQVAVATGFNSAGLVLSGFVLVGLILSVVLTFIKNKRPVSSAAEVVNAEVREA
jgi:DHA2 family lincomycin resistance protein-like MFS transporter